LAFRSKLSASILRQTLYATPFHSHDLATKTFLVTGGAGFIGSNIVEYLVQHRAGLIRILDNLSEGKRENIQPFLALPNVEFIQGDITDPETCNQACEGIELISHQAALGSVPRSIATPLVTNAANVTGFLNMLDAARKAGVKRFVYASSSSVYGDSAELPKVETRIGNPLSPYALSKSINEQYARVFQNLYGIETIGLRYFNVFGPRQKPDGPYAAVIPLFIDSLLKGVSPTINGDGSQSRDFTFVASAVNANIRAMVEAASDATGRAYNIAHGSRKTIIELFQILAESIGSDLQPNHGPDRSGDVKHSHADIDSARNHLGYEPFCNIREGLNATLDWFRSC
jgi:UDP-N-acetylglucosamine/UDP-N-acetylgalactosamine 4-epimerase